MTTPAVAPEIVETAKVFKSRIDSLQYVMRNGKYIPFIKNKYVTTVPDEITELEEEIIKHKNPLLYIDPEEATIIAPLEPLQAMESRLRAKIMAELASSETKNTPENTAGETEQKPSLKGIANSETVKLGSADSSSDASGTQVGNVNQPQLQPQLTTSVAAKLDSLRVK